MAITSAIYKSSVKSTSLSCDCDEEPGLYMARMLYAVTVERSYVVHKKTDGIASVRRRARCAGVAENNADSIRCPVLSPGAPARAATTVV